MKQKFSLNGLSHTQYTSLLTTLFVIFPDKHKDSDLFTFVDNTSENFFNFIDAQELIFLDKVIRDKNIKKFNELLDVLTETHKKS